MVVQFSIVSVDPSEGISGAPGETKTITVTVSNDGDETGDAILRIKDHNGNVVYSDQKTVYAGTCYIFMDIPIILPSELGVYQWRIEVYNVTTSSVDHWITYNVEVTGEEGEGGTTTTDWTQIFVQMMQIVFIISFMSLLITLMVSFLGG